jgi:hypothetical protein
LLEYLPGHGVVLCLQGLAETFDHGRTTRDLLLVCAGDAIQLRESVDTSLALDRLHSLDYNLADMLRAPRPWVQWKSGLLKASLQPGRHLASAAELSNGLHLVETDVN